MNPEDTREARMKALNALKAARDDYQAAYDVQAIVSSVTGKTIAERTAAGVRCDTILMPKIRMLQDAIDCLSTRAELSRPVLDVEGLKVETRVYQGDGNVTEDDYCVGWNACIDHLAASGYLNTPQPVAMEKVREALQEIVNYTDIGRHGRVYQLAEEALALLDQQVAPDKSIAPALRKHAEMKAAYPTCKDPLAALLSFVEGMKRKPPTGNELEMGLHDEFRRTVHNAACDTIIAEIKKMIGA